MARTRRTRQPYRPADPAAEAQRVRYEEARREAREARWPAWFKAHRARAQRFNLQNINLQALQNAQLHLPPYQRPVVWSGAQQLAFLRSMWAGNPTSTCLIWRRWMESGHVDYVLDGQQRMTALGITLRRHDGTPTSPPTWAWDATTNTWSPGGSLTPTMLANAHWVFDQCHHLSEDDLVYGLDVAQGICVPVLYLEDVTPQQAIEAFRAASQPGVPWDPAEIERTIASVVDG